jgi:hypothetical protein
VQVDLPDAGEVNLDISEKVVAAGGVRIGRSQRQPTLDLGGADTEDVVLPMRFEPPVRILSGWRDRRVPLDRLALREESQGRSWITHLFATESLRFSRNGPTSGSTEEVLLRGIPQETHGALSRIFSRATIFSVHIVEDTPLWRMGPGATIRVSGRPVQVVHPVGGGEGPSFDFEAEEAALVLEAPAMVPGLSLKIGLHVERASTLEVAGLLLQDPDRVGPPPLLERGADRPGRVAAVRVSRINNGIEHAYVLVRRWATLGTGPSCSVQTHGESHTGMLARVLFCGREFLVTPVDPRVPVSVDGVAVEPGSAAPLAPGARLQVGGCALLAESVDYERMKGR